MSTKTKAPEMEHAVDTVQDVLEGIDWKRYPTEIGGDASRECHIGRVANYQIYLSEDLERFGPSCPDVRYYAMQLWSFRIKCQENTAIGRNMAAPTYDMLIPPTAFKAANVTEAKVRCVELINAWNERLRDAAQESFARNESVFRNLKKLRSDKIVESLADQSVERLGLSASTVRVLRDNQILLVGMLASTTVKQLKAINGIGDRTLNDILMCLKRTGILLPADGD